MFPYIIQTIEDDDDRAFAESLYISYRKLMFSEINKIVNNPWDAEDIFQNVLEKLMEKLSLLRSLDRPHMANYIITACRHNAISLLREKKREASYSFDEAIDSCEEYSDIWQDSIENQLILQQSREAFFEEWKKLSPETRELLSAKYILKQSDEEIAGWLGIKTNSVRMALTRARREFRKQINQDAKQDTTE